MKPTGITEPGSIAYLAELEMWSDIRCETRQCLFRSLTIGVLYLLAALAVGAYLILAVQEVGTGLFMRRGWELEKVNLDWMRYIAWGYGGMAIIVMILYPLLGLLIHDRIPHWCSWMMEAVPGVGSTMRIVSLGDFCQSMYQSVAASETYSSALDQASQCVRSSSMRHWSRKASGRIAAGQSLGQVLASTPIREPSLFAVIALTSSSTTSTQSSANTISDEDTIRVWYQAALECHTLAQSRSHRTTQMISVLGLLASVFFATLGMFMAATFVFSILTETYGFYTQFESLF